MSESLSRTESIAFLEKFHEMAVEHDRLWKLSNNSENTFHYSSRKLSNLKQNKEKSLKDFSEQLHQGFKELKSGIIAVILYVILMLMILIPVEEYIFPELFLKLSELLKEYFHPKYYSWSKGRTEIYVIMSDVISITVLVLVPLILCVIPFYKVNKPKIN